MMQGGCMIEKIRACHDCDKVYHGPNAGKALAGHVWLKHHKRIGFRRELEARVEQLQVALKASEDRERVLADKLKSALTDLEAEKRMLRPAATGDYCPKCGKPISDHEQRHDLLSGKVRYLCSEWD
jgi:hypothetical protein